MTARDDKADVQETLEYAQARHQRMVRDLAAKDTRIAALEADRALILAERDRTFALMLARAEKAEAERDRLQSEQEQLLADSAIRSDQRTKYEKLCNEMATSPRMAQQEAIDAIKALCRDNERLALLRGKSREKLRTALQAHHEWHLAQHRDGGAGGIDPVDAYSESGLCEQTIAALGATP